MKKGTKFITALLFGLIAALLVSSYSGFAADCRVIRSRVLRLHILANSDTEIDQQLKLKVRDRILRETGDLFDTVKNKEGALTLAEKELSEIKDWATDELRKNGSSAAVTVYTTKMFFTTRTYDEKTTLPAGMYDALRIEIGEADGKNWWCVLFPPLCVPTAEAKESLYEMTGEEEFKVTEKNPKYEVRFFIVEMVEKLFNKEK